MKNRKINLDRPQIDSKEIQAGMNFSQLMVGYQAASKPFYKSNWFFGTTGLASIGLIVGGTFAFQSPDEAEKRNTDDLLTDTPPPEVVATGNNVIELRPNTVPQPVSGSNETFVVNNTNEEKHDKNHNSLIEDQAQVVEAVNVTLDPQVEPGDPGTTVSEKNEIMDLHPRINGITDGDITREDLLDNKGITTGSDVSIIHFELHLIDGLGGRVFEEESNQLNQEMRNALHYIGKGETIYFENIKGRTSDGRVVRLNPLRYVLLN